MNHERYSKDDLEHYAGGEIQARHGIINKWLIATYAVLFLWSIYYLLGPFDGWRATFEVWRLGGLGPGLSGKGAEPGVGGLQVIGAIALSIALISIIGFFAWIVNLTWKK